MFVTQPERVEKGFKGKYLILWTNDLSELRGCIREVTMEPLGNFLTGSAKVGARTVSVSGNFGNDSLPKDADDLWAKLLPVPADLAKDFWEGSPTTFMPKLRTWAWKNRFDLWCAGRKRL